MKRDDKWTQIQKRLRLVNAKELYIEFQTKNWIKIFQNFVNWAKSCLAVSASGMHLVCICEIH